MDSQNSNAKQMIEEHGLEPILGEMLNTMVYRKVKRPEIFMIKYLASHLSKEDQIKYGIEVPDCEIHSVPIVKMPSNIENEALRNHLKNKDTWNKVRYNRSKHGATVMDVVHREGLRIPDADVKCSFNE